MSGWERRLREEKGWFVRDPLDFFGEEDVGTELVDTGFEIKVEDDGSFALPVGGGPGTPLLGTFTLTDEGVRFFLATMFDLQGSLTEPGGVEFMRRMGFITNVGGTPVAAFSDRLSSHPGWTEHPTFSDSASQTAPPPVNRDSTGSVTTVPIIDPTNLIITWRGSSGAVQMAQSGGLPGVQDDVRGIFSTSNIAHLSSSPDRLGWVYIFHNPVNQDVFTPNDVLFTLSYKVTLTIKP